MKNPEELIQGWYGDSIKVTVIIGYLDTAHSYYFSPAPEAY